MNSFKIQSLTPDQKKTRRRILEISKERKLSHIGSCFCAVDLINGIYKIKAKNEKFVLSAGHAGVALYVVLEKNGLIKSEKIKNLHIHPDRNHKIGIDVSTGSLGQGLPIALGMAMSEKNKNTYCLISDGECAEGSIWEALRIAFDNKINNLKIIVNVNGWGAYGSIDSDLLAKKIKSYGYIVKKINGNNIKDVISAIKFIKKRDQTIIFAKTSVNQLPFLKGLDAHYYVMNDDDYKKAINLLK